MNHLWPTFLTWIGENSLVERLFFASLEFAALAAMTALVLWLAQPRTPRFVALVWAFILAKPLVSLLMGSPLHLIQFSLPGPQPAVASIQNNGVTSVGANPAPNSDGVSIDNAGGTELAPNRIDYSGIGSPVSERSSSIAGSKGNFDAISSNIPSPSAPTATRPWDWHSVIIGLWLSGVALMVIRAALVRRRLAQIFAGCQSPNQEMQDRYLLITAAMSVRRPPRLLVTDAPETPALVGLWRTRILVPAWLAAQSDGSALDWSLRHELTHWKHGDLWLIRLRELVRVVFYFHPATWWAGKQLETALEIACDRAVITNEIEAADYARRLVEILDAVRNQRRQPLVGGLFATRSQIARRLSTLVESPLRLRPRLTNSALIGVSLLAAVVLLVGSGVQRDVNAEDEGRDSPLTAGQANTEQAKQSDELLSKKASDGRGVIVAGKVVDESDQPVAGVSVRLYAPAPDEATSTSDANGRFEFLMRRQKLSPLVAIDRDGQRTGYAVCFADADIRYAPRIVLKRIREVTIRVVDAQGSPMAGATYALPGTQYDLDNLLFTGKTGADGTVKLRFSEDARPYQVIAFKSGLGFDYFVSPRRAEQTFHDLLSGEITLKLSGAKTLTIQAQSQTKQPVGGVRFSLDRLRKREASQSASLSNCDAVQIATDASGTAVFDWLPKEFADTLRFTCQSPEYTVREKPGFYDLLSVRADDPVKELTVPVLRRTTVAGRVVGPDGKPHPGITVKAYGVGADRNAGQGEAITDSQGAYRMDVVSEQAYVVSVVDDRWAAPNRIGIIVHENKPVSNVDFNLGEGTVVRGMVTQGADRSAVPNQSVVLMLQAGPIPANLVVADGPSIGVRNLHFSRTSNSDNDGKFRFRVGPGNYKLVAVQSGIISSDTPQANVTVLAQREVVKGLHLQVDKTAPLIGKVVDPDGKPVAKERVFGSYLQTPNQGNDSFAAQTGADGTFELERKALPAVLHTRLDDRKLGGLARISADQNEVTIRLRPLGQARGRFLDDKGQAAPGRLISSGIDIPLEKSGTRSFFPNDALTDAEGKFTLIGMLQGEHTISLREGNRLQHLTKVNIDKVDPINLGDLRVPAIPDQNALALRGKVLASDGKPASGETIRITFLQLPSPGMRRNEQLKTSADGAFEIKRPAVPAVLSIRTADNKYGCFVRVDDRQAEITLKLVPLLGKARGILVDSAGKPVPGAAMSSSIVTRVGSGFSIGLLGVGATASADGSFLLEGLLPGESYTMRYAELNPDKTVSRLVDLISFKLEKTETVDLGKISLPAKDE